MSPVSAGSTESIGRAIIPFAWFVTKSNLQSCVFVNGFPASILQGGLMLPAAPV